MLPLYLKIESKVRAARGLHFVLRVAVAHCVLRLYGGNAGAERGRERE